MFALEKEEWEVFLSGHDSKRQLSERGGLRTKRKRKKR